MAFDAGGQRHISAGTRAVHGAHAVFVMLLRWECVCDSVFDIVCDCECVCVCRCVCECVCVGEYVSVSVKV